MQRPIVNCYLGYDDNADGETGVWLNTEQLYEDNAQIVTDNPTLFTTVTIIDGGTAASSA